MKVKGLRVGYPGGRVGAKVLEAAIVEHLVEGEGKLRREDSFGDLAPRVRSGRAVVADDLGDAAEKPLGGFGRRRGAQSLADVGGGDGVQGFRRSHFWQEREFWFGFSL